MPTPPATPPSVKVLCKIDSNLGPSVLEGTLSGLDCELDGDNCRVNIETNCDKIYMTVVTACDDCGVDPCECRFTGWLTQ